MKPVFKCSWREPKWPTVTVEDVTLGGPCLLPVKLYRVEQVLLGVQLGEYLFLNPRPVIDNVRAVWQPANLVRTGPVSTIVVAVRDDYTWGRFTSSIEATIAAWRDSPRLMDTRKNLEDRFWALLQSTDVWVHYNYHGGHPPLTHWEVRGEDNEVLRKDVPCTPVQAYAEAGYTFYYVEVQGQRHYVGILHNDVLLYRTCYRRLHPDDVTWNTDEIILHGDPLRVICAYPVSRQRPYSFWSLLDLGIPLADLQKEFVVAEQPRPTWQENVATYDPYHYSSNRRDKDV